MPFKSRLPWCVRRNQWGGKNPAGAYVYVYQCEFSIHDDGAVILYDLDGDGGIDQWTEVASTEWSVIEALDWAKNYSG